MSQTEWLVRAARKKDREVLGRFSCAAPEVHWEAEVEAFVRRALLDWAFDPFAKKNDPRLLLVFHREDGDLVGVAAHERTTLRYGTQRAFAATQIEVVAVARTWQGRRFKGGERASDVLMSAVMGDVAGRVPPRDARVFAIVHEENARSIAVCRRHGLVEELSRVHASYRRLVTSHRKSEATST